MPTAIRCRPAHRQIALETKQRLEQLLIRMDPSINPERIRSARALEVLKRIGTAEARNVVEKLSAGVKEAWLTQEARGALKRLAQRAD